MMLIVISILVAEDNLMNQKVILKLLTKIGCNADLACNGLEACHAVEKKHYDLILMDVYVLTFYYCRLTLQGKCRRWMVLKQPDASRR
jgi:DNA-binding response OmpR family regulator